MKKEEFVRAFDAVRPDASMKQRLMRAVENRGRCRFRPDKPVQLIAALGSAAIVCAGTAAILLVLREGLSEGIVPPAASVTTASASSVSPAQSAAPAATMPAGAPYTEDVKLLENVTELVLEPILMNEFVGNDPYSRGREIIKQLTPQGYPGNIKPGLAWEMEKHASDGDYLFDAVIGYKWSEEEYKKVFTYNGMTYEEAEQACDNELRRLTEEYMELKKRHPYDEETKELLRKNQEARAALLKRPYKQAFDAEYRIALEKRWDELLPGYLQLHPIPVMKPIRLEKAAGICWYNRTTSYIYSKFTRDELLYLANNGFTCHLVGKRAPLHRPEGYPDNVSDFSAVALDRSPAGMLLKAYCRVFYRKGKLTIEQQMQARQEIADLLGEHGIHTAIVNTFFDDESERSKGTYVSCEISAQKEVILEFIKARADFQVVTVYYPETSLESYYNKYGDGFAVLPEGSADNTYFEFIWNGTPIQDVTPAY